MPCSNHRHSPCTANIPEALLDSLHFNVLMTTVEGTTHMGINIRVRGKLDGKHSKGLEE
jgi:hypothetical protein